MTYEGGYLRLFFDENSLGQIQQIPIILLNAVNNLGIYSSNHMEIFKLTVINNTLAHDTYYLFILRGINNLLNLHQTRLIYWHRISNFKDIFFRINLIDIILGVLVRHFFC